MTGKPISRTTKVVSVSLDKDTYAMLAAIINQYGGSTSSLIASLIRQKSFTDYWATMRHWGRQSAKNLKITSEDDVYRLLGDA